MPTRAVLLTLLLLSPGLGAAPAPWYLWRSVSGPAEACAQASPGDGWRQVGGPFIDAGCKRRLRVVPL